MPQNVPTSLIPLIQNTIQVSLLPDTLNCLMNHSRSGKWMSYNFLHLKNRNMFQSWSVCFHTGWKPYLENRILPSQWIKVLLKRLSLFGEFLSNSTEIKDSILQARYVDKFAFSGWFYNTFTVLTTLSPLVQLNTVMALIRLS